MNFDGYAVSQALPEVGRIKKIRMVDAKAARLSASFVLSLFQVTKRNTS